MKNLKNEPLKNIEKRLNVSRETAKMIKKVVEMYDNMTDASKITKFCLDNPKTFTNTLDWIYSLYNKPKPYQLCMVMLDELLDNFGKEFDFRLNILYSDAGEPYLDTIIYDLNKFGIGSVGSLAEKASL